MTVTEMRRIREMRHSGARVRVICLALADRGYDRDEVIEAIWASLRHQDDWQAVDHLARVLDYQRRGTPLTNGHPLAVWPRPRPMFA